MTGQFKCLNKSSDPQLFVACGVRTSGPNQSLPLFGGVHLCNDYIDVMLELWQPKRFFRQVTKMRAATYLTLVGRAVIAVAQSGPISVRLQNGTVNGTKCSTTDVNSFLGIPYAQAPVDNLRFASPQPYNQTYDSRDATKPPPACIQFNAAFSEQGSQTEDWYVSCIDYTRQWHVPLTP